MYFAALLSCGINNLGIYLSHLAAGTPPQVRRERSASLMNNRSNDKKLTSLGETSNQTS
jgi:hypothetical protein